MSEECRSEGKGLGDKLVGVHYPMHETVGLPSSNHDRIPPCNLEYKILAPCGTLCNIQPQYPGFYPFAQKSQSIPMRVLLSASEKEHFFRAEGFKRADAEERRSDTSEDAC